MGIADFRIVSFTDFRRNAGPLADWVDTTGGRLWLARRGKLRAAVVPMSQVDILEEFETRPLREKRARMEREYAAWKRVKQMGGGDNFDWARAGEERFANFEETAKREARETEYLRRQARRLQLIAEYDQLLGPEDNPLPPEEVERRFALERLRAQQFGDHSTSRKT